MKILFDPDDNMSGGALKGDERTKYMALCTEITNDTLLSNERYEEITQQLLTYLFADVEEKIEELPYSDDTKDLMRTDVAVIISNIKNKDKNYIGRINIVTFQCAMLFTHYCIVDSYSKEAPGSNFSKFAKSKIHPQDPGSGFVILSGDWKSYVFILEKMLDDPKQYLTSLYIIMDRHYPSITTKPTVEKPIHLRGKDDEIFKQLITILDYLSVDEIINSYLNKVNYSGLSSSYINADAELLSPYDFILHDVGHSLLNTRVCSIKKRVNYEEVKAFYEFCRGRLEKSEFYCIKLFIFILLHESLCDFYNVTDKSTLMGHMTMKASGFTFDEPLKRLQNLDDLGLSIPKANRGDVLSYISHCADVFLSERRAWDSRSSGVNNNNNNLAAAIALSMNGAGAGGSRRYKKRKTHKRKKTKKAKKT